MVESSDMSVFPSFVKNFALTDLSGALTDYAELLTSSELGARRRQALRSAHGTFTKNRLRGFWFVGQCAMKDIVAMASGREVFGVSAGRIIS